MMPAGKEPRAVITGLGVVSPLGLDVESFWRAALTGELGTGEITRFDTSRFLTHRGGEIHDFPVASGFRKLDPDLFSRSTQLAVAAARQAVEDAGLEPIADDERPAGVIFGSVLGARPDLEATVAGLSRKHREGRRALGAFSHTAGDDTEMTRAVALELGLGGPNRLLPTACAAGNYALSEAARRVRQGTVRAMVAGGADALSPAMFMMFNRFESLAPDLVRPFDRDRRGLMLAEGAAALVVEDHRRALARGARIYGEVLGWGEQTDAYHMTAPHPEGLGAVRSMRQALATAGVEAEEVSYVSAHGTGTPLNDAAEARALMEVFGRGIDPEVGTVPVSSLKSMVGHAQGAASALEAASCLLAMRDGRIPPNANYETPDPECPLAVVAGEALERPVEVALNNAFGFGGNISCVALGRFREER